MEEADDRVDGTVVGRGSMDYFAQPPETVESFIPEVCSRGEGRGADATRLTQMVRGTRLCPGASNSSPQVRPLSR